MCCRVISCSFLFFAVLVVWLCTIDLTRNCKLLSFCLLFHVMTRQYCVWPDSNTQRNTKLSGCWQSRATRLEVSQGHQTWYLRYVGYGFLLVCFSNFVLRCTVFEIFDFKNLRVRGHSRSLKVVQFHRLRIVSITLSLRDIGLAIIPWPWNPGYESLKVIWTDTCRFATYHFLITSYSSLTMGLSRSVSQVNDDFSRKCKYISPLSMYFEPPLTGFSLELVSTQDHTDHHGKFVWKTLIGN